MYVNQLMARGSSWEYFVDPRKDYLMASFSYDGELGGYTWDETAENGEWSSALMGPGTCAMPSGSLTIAVECRCPSCRWSLSLLGFGCECCKLANNRIKEDTDFPFIKVVLTCKLMPTVGRCAVLNTVCSALTEYLYQLWNDLHTKWRLCTCRLPGKFCLLHIVTPTAQHNNMLSCL